MAPSSQPERPSELVYLPEPSWAPLLTAAGLALIVAGLAIGWVLSVIGLLLFVPGLWSWIGDVRAIGREAAAPPAPRHRGDPAGDAPQPRRRVDPLRRPARTA